MSKCGTYMSLESSRTYELKIYAFIKNFKERNEWTEERIENGDEETEISYEVKCIDSDGDVVGTGYGDTVEEAVMSFERGW